MRFHSSLTAQIGSTESELKKLAEENPELKDAYISKQRRLKVRNVHLLEKKKAVHRLSDDDDDSDCLYMP